MGRDNRLDIQDTDEGSLRAYALARATEENGVATAALWLGEDRTILAIGKGEAPERSIALRMGSALTGGAFFRHEPPLPAEIEEAINAVEDELARAADFRGCAETLRAAGPGLKSIAKLAGADEGSALSRERFEELFSRLAARSLGRSAAADGIPTDAAAAARLLILRECLHHLDFESLLIVG